MPYCHQCGKKNDADDLFCFSCGSKLSTLVPASIEENVSGTEQRIEREFTKKKGHKGIVFLIIFFLIIFYIALDLWAMSQLTPVFSADSILTTIGNSDASVGLTKSSASTTIRMKNPTFVPILFTRITYDAGYGNTKIAEGKTGFFVMAPNSEKDIPIDLRVYNWNAVKSGLKAIWNAITGQNEKPYINVYADLGITKFKIGGS